jgi:hypothetical protein
MGTGSGSREEPEGFGFFHSRRRSSVTYFSSGDSTRDMDSERRCARVRERGEEGGADKEERDNRGCHTPLKCDLEKLVEIVGGNEFIMEF